MTRHLEEPEVWKDPERARRLGRERSLLSERVELLSDLDRGLKDAAELLDLAREEEDLAMLHAVAEDLETWEAALARLEFRRMFSQEMDPANAFLDVQAGSGGTEAQDWAEMLLRMYLRWGERRGFGAELIAVSPGEVAGIKGASVLVTGDHAFGWLRTETGVHRLVRKSALRFRAPPAYFVRGGVRVAGGRRRHRRRRQPRGPAHRRLSRERRGRPAREPHRVGGAHHPPAHQTWWCNARTTVPSTRTRPRR